MDLGVPVSERFLAENAVTVSPKRSKNWSISESRLPGPPKWAKTGNAPYSCYGTCSTVGSL